jgi:hypothetical protein
MFHLNTEQLIDYWREQRGADAIPFRSSIDPARLVKLLPHVFMLGREAPGRYRFRLVGGFIGELHGRDLRHQGFLDLWRSEDRTPLQLAIEAIRRIGEPLVLECDARAFTGETMRAEITVAPLIGPSGEVDRFIGLYQPASPVAELKDHPVFSLTLRGMNTHGDQALPRLLLATVGGRRIA